MSPIRHRGRPLLAATCLALAVALTAAGCGGGGKKKTNPSPGPTPTSGASVDWPNFGNTLDNTRYSPLKDINTSNVSKLGVAWTMPEGQNITTWETYPIVVGGTMYVTTNTDQVIALNAATGQVKWKYSPPVNFYLAVAGGGGGVPTNRGVAVGDGKVFLLTFDDKLIALQQSTGEKLWQSQVADPHQGYSETSPPTFWKGKLFLGSAESDAGLRGFVASYDANTGKRIWQTYTVPAPGHGWMPAKGQHGGGDVWMPPTVDAKTNTVVVGTGNPSPDLINSERPGCNPWVDATVAMDADTGKIKWGRTEVCPDLWDYDSHQPPMIFDLPDGTHAVGQANKSGFYFVLNGADGKILSKSPAITPQTTPRPKPTAKGVNVCPGALGGIEYTPAAYSPQTHLVYQPALNVCMKYATVPVSEANTHQTGQIDFGGTFLPLAKPAPSGYMAAVDATTGKIKWKQKFSKPMVGGALATGGNVVFSGADDGHFYAFDANTGKILWSPNVGLPFGAAPITYKVNGVQYVAVAAGGSNAASITQTPTGGTLVVFKVGGKPVPKLPTVKPAGASKQQQPNLADFKQIQKDVYADVERKQVVFKIVAAETSKGSGFNFNGYYKGEAKYVVPVGWSVTMEFTNKSEVPHSMELTKSIKGTLTPAVIGVAPVAAPANPAQGIRPGITQLTGFTMQKAGTFYLACGVPGHVKAGMWDNLVASATAKLPSIQVKK